MNDDEAVRELDAELLALVHSRRGKHRQRAVEELKAVPASRAVPVLGGLLYDGRTNVADAAAEALRQHFGAAGRAALLEALDGEHEWARLAAARSLACDREPSALAALDEALRGPDADQWGPALDRMVLFGTAARPMLERELLDEENGSWLREMCAATLAKAAGEGARPVLERIAASNDVRVARAAQRALASLDSGRSAD